MSTEPCPGIILIGGASGVGKTTTANALIDSFPGRFSRLRATSSRPKRSPSDTEYVAATKREIRQLERAGELVNCDSVYGELYAVRQSDIVETWSTKHTPIKEIHPDNFPAFEAFCKHTMAVILKGPIRLAPTASMAIRQKADEATYRGYSWSDAAHVVVDTVNFATPQDVADHLYSCFLAHIDSVDRYPDCRRIDKDNKQAYDTLAPAFTADKRLTTRDFHCASADSLRAAIGAIHGDQVLEVGTGRGWLSSTIDLRRFNVTHHDGSAEMLKFLTDEDAARSVVGPIRDLPFPCGKFDAVIGSLIDGMLYPIAVTEISRVLRPGGLFIFSYPSAVWAAACRQGGRNATFDDGRSLVSAHSFSPSRAEIPTLLRCGGMSTIDFMDLPARLSGDLPLSPALFNPLGQLPDAIVSVVIARSDVNRR